MILVPVSTQQIRRREPPFKQLLWDLEARGLEIVVQDGQLRVSPRSRITAADDAAIRRHRDELVTLVDHCEAIQ